ncbi:unnamed protein product [Linum trigynum]|uniref:Uncharacterized protein n=1 Tax=Linum trigynum TaxID=586398 RepID=A0AAV2E930_9ROSI
MATGSAGMGSDDGAEELLMRGDGDGDWQWRAGSCYDDWGWRGCRQDVRTGRVDGGRVWCCSSPSVHEESKTKTELELGFLS